MSKSDHNNALNLGSKKQFLEQIPEIRQLIEEFREWHRPLAEQNRALQIQGKQEKELVAEKLAEFEDFVNNAGQMIDEGKISQEEADKRTAEMGQALEELDQAKEAIYAKIAENQKAQAQRKAEVQGELNRMKGVVERFVDQVISKQSPGSSVKEQWVQASQYSLQAMQSRSSELLSAQAGKPYWVLARD